MSRQTAIDYLIQNLIKEKFIDEELIQTYQGGSRFNSLIENSRVIEKDLIIESFEDGGGKNGDEYYLNKIKN